MIESLLEFKQVSSRFNRQVVLEPFSAGHPVPQNVRSDVDKPIDLRTSLPGSVGGSHLQGSNVWNQLLLRTVRFQPVPGGMI